MEISRDQVVMPIIVATMIDKDDFVFKMAEILGKLDYRKLRSIFADSGERLKPMPNGSALLVRKYWIFSFSM